jgi:hypothetical protein
MAAFLGLQGGESDSGGGEDDTVDGADDEDADDERR